MNVIDAKTADGRLVAIKRLENKGQEIEVAQFLTSLKHPHKHCVPVEDVFPDPSEPNWMFMVMPYLRRFDDPEFELIGEVIEFARQMLEVRGSLYSALSETPHAIQGLEFLHSNRVAHR